MTESVGRRASAWRVAAGATAAFMLTMLPTSLAVAADESGGNLRAAAVAAAACLLGLAGGLLIAWRVGGAARRDARLITHLAAVATAAIADRRGQAMWASAQFRHRFAIGDENFITGLERTLATDAAARERFAALRRAAASGATARELFTSRRSDGTAETLAVSVGPIADMAGCSTWQIEDVTTARQFAEDSRTGTGDSLEFLEHAPIGLYSVDGEGRFLSVNQTLAMWLGVTAAELTAGKLRLHQIIAGEPPKDALPYDPFGGQTGDYVGEVRMKSRTGRVFDAFVSQVVLREGGTVRARAVVRDLTPERELAAALLRSERSFRRFFEEAPVGIALIDDRFHVIEANQAFQRMTKLARAAGEGDSFVELLRPEERSETAALLARMMRENLPPAVLEVRFQRDGRETTASLYASRVDPGMGGGLVLHMLDTTEQRRLESQFAQSQKMQAIGQLAGGIAHDFNNLLTAMIGFCDLLLLRHRPGDQSFPDIMQIKQNANRAASLVRQLLAFSRQQTLQPKVLDVTDSLSELTHLLRRLIGENI
ncbi:MAG: PAS domain S-box protein, partial [Proteobacteria bacterium]|nr:PAS domain S-box protein [Pseudomonadota bacterium]